MRKSISRELKAVARSIANEVGHLFVEIPREEWPEDHSPLLMRAWRNRSFIVQLAADGSGFRISVSRTGIKGFRKDRSPEWEDGITWEELMEIKRGVGYGDCWAVECFPPDRSIVNVANMRHLWILEGTPNFGWKP